MRKLIGWLLAFLLIMPIAMAACFDPWRAEGQAAALPVLRWAGARHRASPLPGRYLAAICRIRAVIAPPLAAGRRTPIGSGLAATGTNCGHRAAFDTS